MDFEEQRTFAILLSAYKKVLIDYQTLKFIHDHPVNGAELEWDEVRSKFFEEVRLIFEPIETALVEGKPLLNEIQDALKKV